MAINTNFNNTRPSLLLDFANSQQLDPRVTFSRSTTAPYYDGKTSVLAEQNILTYSQLFSNAVWLTGNVTNTTTSATNAPDGTTTAFSSIPTTTNATHQLCEQGITQVSGLQYTFSISVKANGYTLVAITQYTGSANVSSFFDLSAGTVTSGTGSIASQGNGWYRVSQTVTATTSAFNQYACQLFAVNTGTNTSFAGDGTSGYYIWGGQCENRNAVTAYNATTTTAITNYIPQLLTAPINAPRFDFNPTTGESLGLLIEQSSTNLGLYSQLFDNAYWVKTNATITPTSDIAPDGTQTAQLAVIPATTAVTTIYGNATSTSIPYTVTAYVKSYGLQYVNVGFIYSSGIYSATQFDITNGTIIRTSSASYTSPSATITAIGNGWYRCTHTCTVNTATIYHCINPSNVLWTSGEPRQSLTGNGYSGIYIWGAQLEALSFPTSYIATTSAQVTRGADVATMTGTNFSSWYNNQQGTIYSESSLFNTSIFPGIYSLDDGTTNNALNSFGGTIINANARINGSNIFTSASSTLSTTTAFYKQSFAYNNASYVSVFSGGTPVTQSSGLVPPNLNRLQIGLYNSAYLNGRMKKFAYYPQAVTSAQLQALTGT
jgi:hypothetical protein